MKYRFRDSFCDASTSTRVSGVVYATALLVIIVSSITRADEQKFGLESRIPWTSGHVTGTPEPPPAFELQRLYPKLHFKSPLEIAFATDSDRIFIAEQPGKIFSFHNTADPSSSDLAIDFRETVKDWNQIPGCTGFDSIYGMALHPDFAHNHFIFVCYALAFRQRPTEPVGTRVVRYTVTGDPPRFDPASEKRIIEWQAGGHNGGCLRFGKDGMLYISAGDQADPNPPDVYNTGQDISDLRSSILRIDIDHPNGDKAYSIPRDNPFVRTPGARGEVWCYGLRNPWRFSIDRATGNVWVADVGWELWESVHCAKPGGNYGWSIMEGPNPVHPDGKRGPTPITPPLLALSHAESASITGGNVYRGKKYPQLVGQYVFGDWETRRLWAAKLIGDDKLEPHRTIAETDARIVSFGEDRDGELYIVDHEGGGIYTIAPNEAANHPSSFPRTLKATGLFSDVAKQSPAPGVLPFSVIVPQWVDGAVGERFVALPGEGKVKWRTDDVYSRPQRSFPKDAVLVRTLSLDITTGEPSSRRKLETQLLQFDGKQWHAYSYRWREDQADADLVDANGADLPLTINDRSFPGGKRPQTWHYASRAQCMTCHNSWAAYTLGFTDEQINCDQKYDTGVTDNQLHTLRHIGLIPEAARPQPTPENPRPPNWPTYSLVNPYDTSADLDQRVRSYLHVNCSQCHRMGGGGAALFDVRKEMSLKQTGLVNAAPMLGTLGLDDARIVYPGEPNQSVLLYRIAKNGLGRMPRIGSDVVDDRAVAMIAQWITRLGDGSTAPTIKNKSPKEAVAALKTSGAEQAINTLLTSPSGALSLICALENEHLSDATRTDIINRGVAAPLPAVRDLFDRFNPNASQAPRLGLTFDRQKLLTMKGDAARGKNVFQNLAQCATCHFAGDVRVREFGPDLSHIAAKYNKAQLLENIVEPSKTIAEGFATYNVQRPDGDVISGFLVGQNDSEVVLKDPNLQLIHIPKAQVKALKAQAISAMPEGLLANLEPQQAADLLEFLARQK